MNEQGVCVSLTVEVGPVDLVEEQVELRRLRLHHTVQRHTHFEMSLEFLAQDRGRQSLSRSVLWLRYYLAFNSGSIESGIIDP